MQQLVWFPALAALTLALAAPAAAQVSDPVFDWNDRERGAALLDDWRPALFDAPYFETWDHWFWTTEGEFVNLQFVVSSLGFGIERQGSIRATVILPGGVSLGGYEDNVYRGRRGFEWEDGDWSFERDGFRVDFADCYIGGDGEVFEIRFHDNTVKFEATMRLVGPMFEPGDGVVELGWDRALRFELDVLPRVEFEGRLSTRRNRHLEETWRDVRGVGYVEHTRTRGLPVSVGSQWVGFRALRSDGLTILYDDHQVPAEYGGRRLPWVLVLLDGRELFYSTDVQVVQTDIRPAEHPPSVYPVPYGYQVQAVSGSDVVWIDVRDAELVQQDNILSRVSRLVRAVLSGMMNPMDYDFTVNYDAYLRIDGAEASVSGRGWSTVNFPR